MSLVTTEIREGVAILTMNDPSRRNAMGRDLLAALLEALKAARSGASLVVQGAGGSFSSGADVSEVLDETALQERMAQFTAVYDQVSGFPRPTVAAIDGHCIGGGAEVAMACDLRVGTPGCSFRFPGARFGIPVGTARLQAALGIGQAKDLLMTARTVDGEEAFGMGLLNRLVAPGDLLATALELAAMMAGNPGAVTQKQIIDGAYGLTPAVRRENRDLMRWQAGSRNPPVVE